MNVRRSALRRIVLPIFARVNPGDITIRHHFTDDPVRLHSFKHKGYWFFGRRREQQTMDLLPRLIHPGDTVIEVGGHIGYVALFFSRLVGKRGRVWVFEPGTNNLPYTHANLDGKANVTIVEKGAGRANETMTFFMEDLTGQNNSFVPSFHVLDANRRNAGVRDAGISESQVEVVTLDDFAAKEQARPAFVKVDVEGFELAVLEGMLGLLRTARPIVMLEIQADHAQILKHFADAGYLVFLEDGTPVRSAADVPSQDRPFNLFALHAQAHERELLLFER